MNTVLIVMWFAVSQSYMRETEYYPQINMQTFQSMKACEAAAVVLKKMANGKNVQTACIAGA